jgi:hypothetical protein
MYEHICEIREQSLQKEELVSFTFLTKYSPTDVEEYEKTTELLSELEEKRILVFKEYYRRFTTFIKKRCSRKFEI